MKSCMHIYTMHINMYQNSSKKPHLHEKTVESGAHETSFDDDTGEKSEHLDENQNDDDDDEKPTLMMVVAMYI